MSKSWYYHGTICSNHVLVNECISGLMWANKWCTSVLLSITSETSSTNQLINQTNEHPWSVLVYCNICWSFLDACVMFSMQHDSAQTPAAWASGRVNPQRSVSKAHPLKTFTTDTAKSAGESRILHWPWDKYYLNIPDKKRKPLCHYKAGQHRKPFQFIQDSHKQQQKLKWVLRWKWQERLLLELTDAVMEKRVPLFFPSLHSLCLVWQLSADSLSICLAPQPTDRQNTLFLKQLSPKERNNEFHYFNHQRSYNDKKEKQKSTVVPSETSRFHSLFFIS